MSPEGQKTKTRGKAAATENPPTDGQTATAQEEPENTTVREHDLSPLTESAGHRAHVGAPRPNGEGGNIDLLMDVSVPVVAQLGSTEMRIKDILQLLPGSIVELEKLAGEPVDLLVRGQLFAQGEVVVVDESFGVRISKIITQNDQEENDAKA